MIRRVTEHLSVVTRHGHNPHETGGVHTVSIRRRMYLPKADIQHTGYTIPHYVEDRSKIRNMTQRFSLSEPFILEYVRTQLEFDSRI